MRLLIVLILLAFAAGVVKAFLAFGGAFLSAGPIAVPFAAGVLIGILADQLILRRVPAIGTFEHELTHALCATLFFRRLESFVVRRDGSGAVRHRGGFGGVLGDDFIGLAPYFLPTMTVASILIRPLLGPQWFPGLDIGIGGSFGYHIWTTLREMRGNGTGRIFPDAFSGRPAQSDIAQRGFAYSFIFIAVFSLAVGGFLAAVLLQGYPGIPAWARTVWETTWRLGIRALGSIRL